MEHEEEEDQEIGLQQDIAANAGASTEEQKESTGAQEGESQATEIGADGKPQYPRKRKDYGKDYNPNYKKGPWRKGQNPQGVVPTEEFKKGNFAPPVPRVKTDRGDYVVTSFSIPDRVSDTKAKVKTTEEGEEKQKKRRVGAFHVDDSDEEEA